MPWGSGGSGGGCLGEELAGAWGWWHFGVGCERAHEDCTHILVWNGILPWHCEGLWRNKKKSYNWNPFNYRWLECWDAESLTSPDVRHRRKNDHKVGCTDHFEHYHQVSLTTKALFTNPYICLERALNPSTVILTWCMAVYGDKSFTCDKWYTGRWLHIPIKSKTKTLGALFLPTPPLYNINLWVPAVSLKVRMAFSSPESTQKKSLGHKHGRELCS